MPKTIRIIIPEGTEITQCKTFDELGKPLECFDKTKTTFLNEGELQYNSTNKTALFKGPSFAQCNELRSGNCIAEFTLPERSLNLLKADNQGLASLIIPGSAKPIVKPAQPSAPSIPPAPPSPPATSFPSSLLLNAPGFFLSPAVVGLSVFIVLFTFRKRIFASIAVLFVPPKKRQKDIKSAMNLASSSNLYSSQDIATSTNSDAINVLKSQIISLTKELKVNTAKLNGLEDDVIGLNQRLQSLEGKSLVPKIDQIFPSLNSVVTSVVPAPPPPPLLLSIDLIKQAVTLSDYNLISDYPHFFLSETTQSQQGLEEVKRFMIDSDQTQASSRTQSEFIAITCNAETFLIPNIVPNAADPARTLKRHSDKNNIYRNGQGNNLLNLEQLAVVQRNGDHFDLIKAGLIA